MLGVLADVARPFRRGAEKGRAADRRRRARGAGQAARGHAVVHDAAHSGGGRHRRRFRGPRLVGVTDARFRFFIKKKFFKDSAESGTGILMAVNLIYNYYKYYRREHAQ